MLRKIDMRRCDCAEMPLALRSATPTAIPPAAPLRASKSDRAPRRQQVAHLHKPLLAKCLLWQPTTDHQGFRARVDLGGGVRVELAGVAISPCMQEAEDSSRSA